MDSISTQEIDQARGTVELPGQLEEENVSSESPSERNGSFERPEPTALVTVPNDQPVTESKAHGEEADGYEMLDEDAAAEVRSKVQADWWGWLCDVVRSNLPLKKKRRQLEYALQISDPLIECQFETIFDQNTSWEVKRLSLTERNGFGFKKINWALLKIGLKLKNNGHLTNDEKDFLRGDTSSGRWRMQAYVEQFIALIAWEINRPDKIPARFKKWCPPRTPDQHFPLYEDVLRELESEEYEYDDHHKHDHRKQFKPGRKW